MPVFVVDTNVLVVANGKSDHVSGKCVRAAISQLSMLKGQGIVALDTLGRIFGEYLNHCDLSGEPGVGDEFLKHLFDNMRNEKYCKLVMTTETAENTYLEFPDDSALARFDPSDRKFVAVALVCEPIATIINGTDTDWHHHSAALVVHGVNLIQLCPELMN